MYDPPKTSLDVNIGKNAPVIAIPIYWMKDSMYVVVDGNHRIAKAKKLNKESINVYTTTAKIAYDCIIGEFEKGLYALFAYVDSLTHMGI